MPSGEVTAPAPNPLKSKLLIWGPLACCLLPIVLIIAAIILVALGLVRVSVPTINPFSIFSGGPGGTPSNDNSQATNASGRCQTVGEIQFEGRTYKLRHTSGRTSAEDHLATNAETFRCGAYPCTDPSADMYHQRDQIERHYQVTNMPSNYPKRPWTPKEGGGQLGGGNSGKPSPTQEPWIINQLWSNEFRQPPANLKILVCNPSNGKCFIATGAFEKGPNAGEGEAGIQTEGGMYLSASHGANLTFGYLVDQSVSGPYGGLGPVDCGSGTSPGGGSTDATLGDFALPLGNATCRATHNDSPHTTYEDHGLFDTSLGGLDWNLSVQGGEPVYAITSGTIYEVKYQRKYQNYFMRFRSDDGRVRAVYAHTRPMVSSGAHVAKGQQIGTLLRGNMGHAHLHFELGIDGRPIRERAQIPYFCRH